MSDRTKYHPVPLEAVSSREHSGLPITSVSGSNVKMLRTKKPSFATSVITAAPTLCSPAARSTSPCPSTTMSLTVSRLRWVAPTAPGTTSATAASAAAGVERARATAASVGRAVSSSSHVSSGARPLPNGRPTTAPRLRRTPTACLRAGEPQRFRWATRPHGSRVTVKGSKPNLMEKNRNIDFH